MNKLYIHIIFVLLTLIVPSITNAQPYKVIGYYPNWAIYRSPSFKPHEIDGSLVTHINYAFAKVTTNGSIELFDSWADTDYRSDWNSERPYWGNFKALQDLKQKYPHIKTLISVGGWTLSDPFPALVKDPAARSNFAQNAVAFCKKYGFDGVDIDWEYPGFTEHSGTPEDTKNFTLLLQELYRIAKASNSEFLITIAAPAGPWHYQNMEISKIHPYLDWINLMTYDLHGPWGDQDNQVTNHQSALFPPAMGNPQLCITSAVQYYLSQGVPAEKLIVGMPLYGRVFANAGGLYTPYQGAGPGTTQEVGIRFFYDIKQKLRGYQLLWDEEAQVPYLYNANNREFITFDNEQSLRCKSQFIKKMGLGGAMVWELGLDTRPSWDAMHAIVDELNK